MPLIVLYDPQFENAFSEDINGYPMSHEDRNIHYWAMREGNPFQTLDVLWIQRRYHDNEDNELFHNITNLVTVNIDHMYVWIEDEDIFDNIQGWVVDTDEDFTLNQAQMGALRALTHEDVFLAVEMTEQIAWSTNALQRCIRLIECAQNNIPTIYALPGQGYRSRDWPTGRRGAVNANAGDDNGHAYWWRRTRDAVVNLIEQNEEITRDNIQQIIEIELPPTTGDFGGVKLEPFCKWTTQFAMALWDSFNSIVYIERLPDAFAYVPIDYAWSGTQLSNLFSIIGSEIDRQRGNESQEDWSARWAGLKLQQRAFRENQMNQSATRHVASLRRSNGYDEIMTQNGYPASTFYTYSQERDSRSPEQHFSLRTKNGRSGLNRVNSIDGDDLEERFQSILDWLNTNDHFDYPQHGRNFSLDRHLETITNGMIALLARNTILVTRIEHKPRNNMPISHTNMSLMMQWMDLQFCRSDAEENIRETRPNAFSTSPYSRRHVLATFFQNMRSDEYFLVSYFNGTAAAGWLTWAQNSDVLIFTDGIFLGELWWPEGVNQLSDVPQVGTPI